MGTLGRERRALRRLLAMTSMAAGLLLPVLLVVTSLLVLVAPPAAAVSPAGGVEAVGPGASSTSLAPIPTVSPGPHAVSGGEPTAGATVAGIRADRTDDAQRAVPSSGVPSTAPVGGADDDARRGGASDDAAGASAPSALPFMAGGVLVALTLVAGWHRLLLAPERTVRPRHPAELR